MEIKNYEQGDEKEILKLFEVSFNKSMSERFWKWRFLDNPLVNNPGDFIQLMWDGDKLVGHYAVSPLELTIKNKIKKAALSMTTMTHPDYGGQGVFTQLAKQLYHDLKVKNYSIIMGFPNNNSHYGFVKRLGWKDIATIPTFSVDSKIIMTYGNDIEYNIIEGFCSKTYIKHDTLISTLRSSDFTNWRFNRNPKEKYYTISHNDNYLVFKYYNKNEIDILDYQFKNADPIKVLSLLKSILKVSKTEIEKVNIWLNIHSEDLLLLEKTGFSMKGNSTFFSALDLTSDNKEIYDYQNWEINYSLSDLY